MNKRISAATDGAETANADFDRFKGIRIQFIAYIGLLDTARIILETPGKLSKASLHTELLTKKLRNGELQQS